MSEQKTNGMAFEWAVGLTLESLTGCKIILDQNALPPKDAFETKINESKKENFLRAANGALVHILGKEKITNDSSNQGSIKFNSDADGQKGDVRDVLLHINGKTIGFSCKNNHEALKHSRLSGKLDFVKKWGLDDNGCSQSYWDKIKPIFSELKQIKDNSGSKELWDNLVDKPSRFYWPLLDAWADEVQRLCNPDNQKSPEVCKALISYLIGRNDFYKIICQGNKSVDIQAYNFHGTLATRTTKYPNFINAINNKNGGVYSKTIAFNHGYSINFRIHNASSRVEPSLKFDIKAIGLPSNEVYQHNIEF